MMSWNIDRNSNEIEQLKKALAEADSVVVGAGAGLRLLPGSLTPERDSINTSAIL